jgi:hypothetical protein
LITKIISANSVRGSGVPLTHHCLMGFNRVQYNGKPRAFPADLGEVLQEVCCAAVTKGAALRFGEGFEPIAGQSLPERWQLRGETTILQGPLPRARRQKPASHLKLLGQRTSGEAFSWTPKDGLNRRSEFATVPPEPLMTRMQGERRRLRVALDSIEKPQSPDLKCNEEPGSRIGSCRIRELSRVVQTATGSGGFE